MALTVKDILILDYFDGIPTHKKIPDFKLPIYGTDANERFDALFAAGWVRISRPQETVNMLPDKALSDFLVRCGLSGEGTHAELVRRMISHVPEKDYAYAVPKVYVVSDEGKAAIGHHMAYVLNVRENYGLTEGELGESKTALAQRGEPYTARDILLRAFDRKINLYILAGEWSKLRNMYYVVANFYLRIKKEAEALTYLYLVFFIDMSGMGNKNNLVPYENLFPTQKGMILLMDEVRQRQKLSLDDVKSAFLTNLARRAPRLPFSYFSPQLMATLLLERLRGVEFKGAKYIAVRNVPDASATSYHYVPYGRSESTEENKKVKAVQPHVMVPPVLRMPQFATPPPFIPSEAKTEKVPRRKPVHKPVKEEKIKKGSLHFLKKWF